MSQGEQEEPPAPASAAEVARIPKRERPQSEASGDSLRQEHKRQLIGAAIAAASMDETEAEVPTPAGLDPSQVQAARRLELDRLVEFGVYRSVPRAEASHVIGTRWVEVQKNPELVRSRLVAKEFAWDHREDLFAATPGLAATRIAISALVDRWAAGEDWIARSADVSVAFLHAPVDSAKPQFVEPPPDAGEPLIGFGCFKRASTVHAARLATGSFIWWSSSRALALQGPKRIPQSSLEVRRC